MHKRSTLNTPSSWSAVQSSLPWLPLQFLLASVAPSSEHTLRVSLSPSPASPSPSPVRTGCSVILIEGAWHWRQTLSPVSGGHAERPQAEPPHAEFVDDHPSSFQIGKSMRPHG